MLQKLSIIAIFAGVLLALYFLCMHATPRRGWLRAVEHVCMGIILCYLCGLILAPFGVHVAQSPVSAVSAGYLGLPGMALAVFTQLWR